MDNCDFMFSAQGWGEIYYLGVDAAQVVHDWA